MKFRLGCEQLEKRENPDGDMTTIGPVLGDPIDPTSAPPPPPPPPPPPTPPGETYTDPTVTGPYVGW
jgi:hypothetical protein